jgi:hypothetical protein
LTNATYYDILSADQGDHSALETPKGKTKQHKTKEQTQYRKEINHAERKTRNHAKKKIISTLKRCRMPMRRSKRNRMPTRKTPIMLIRKET